MRHIQIVSHTIILKTGEKCNWAFASVPGHPIWIEVMNAVTQAVFQDVKNQFDAEENNETYVAKSGKLEVLCMTGPMIMTNTMNRYMHNFEHIAKEVKRVKCLKLRPSLRVNFATVCLC